MNKKVMAVAVAGVLAGPASVALAQTSTVQIGGSITGAYYQHNPNNNTVGKKTDIMETIEPEIYIRGEESLGGGLKAWFQCTSSFDVIGGTPGGGAQGWCARNSGIGFQAGWGNLFMGNWDTPEKLVYNAARGWFGGTNSLTGGNAILLETAGGGAPSGVTNFTNASGFFRRQAQTWNYHSPSWNGFSFQGAFSASNEQTGIVQTNPLKPRMYSLAGQYSSGPLYLGVGYEQHKDYNPAAQAIGTTAATYAGGTDYHWTVVGGYTFAGVFNLRGVWVSNNYDTTNSTSLDNRGWGVFADWNIQGPHTLRANYARIGSSGGTSALDVVQIKAPLRTGCGPGSLATTSCAVGNGANQWALAYSYAFSKRTMGSVVYSKTNNDIGGTWAKGKVAASAGNSQNSAGIMLQHRF